MNISGNNIQKRETSLHVGKNNKEKPNNITTKNVTNHQQQKIREPRGYFTFTRPFIHWI